MLVSNFQDASSCSAPSHTWAQSHSRGLPRHKPVPRRVAPPPGQPRQKVPAPQAQLLRCQWLLDRALPKKPSATTARQRNSSFLSQERASRNELAPRRGGAGAAKSYLRRAAALTAARPRGAGLPWQTGASGRTASLRGGGVGDALIPAPSWARTHQLAQRASGMRLKFYFAGAGSPRSHPRESPSEHRFLFLLSFACS